jgi:hypothetical protein
MLMVNPYRARGISDILFPGFAPGVNRVGGGFHRRPLTPPDVLTYHGGFY